jgi:hypothetical protein
MKKEPESLYHNFLSFNNTELDLKLSCPPPPQHKAKKRNGRGGRKGGNGNMGEGGKKKE